MDEIDLLLQQRAATGNPAAMPPVDDIDAMLQQRAASTAPMQANLAQKATVSPKNENGAMMNLFTGAMKGLADTVQAPAQLVLNTANKINEWLPGEPSKSLSTATNDFNQYLANQEKAYQEATPNSIAAGIGRVGAGVLPAFATGGSAAAPKGLQLGKAMIQGGGLTALTQPVNDVTTTPEGNDYFALKGAQAGMGAAGGAIGAVGGKILGGLLAPKVSKDSAAALKEGITPTIGQMYGGAIGNMENKLTSVPLVGDLIKNAQRGTTEDLNRAVYNRVLKPLGKDASDIPIGREGVLKVKEAVGKAYDELLPKLNFKGDVQFGDELTNVTKMVNGGNLPPEISRQFNGIVQNNVLSRMTKNGTMDGAQFKVLESDLGSKIKSFKGSMDPNQRELGNALSEVMDSLRSSLIRSNPESAKKLSDINGAYANYAILRQAARNPSAENGVFTPSQLNSAVYALDKSVGKGKFATGQATMQDLADIGKNIAPTYPDSGTVGRGLAAAIPTAAIGFATAPLATTAGLGAAGLASLPYTATGKALAAKLLTKRPVAATKMAEALRQISPATGAIGLSPLVPLLNNGD